VVVTAQKRSEDLQKVPVSIGVLSGDTLAQMHIEQPADLAGRIPNLQMENTIGNEVPIFSLRGVSMSDYSLSQDGPIATYYEGVYKGNFALLGDAMFDLERIEVLRGPQGTLYGKNATGGAINLIDKKPGFDTEGYVDASYGNYNRREFAGAFQTALTGELAARVAFSYTRQNGWFKNLLPGHPDLNAANEYGARGELLFKPSDTLNFLLIASTSNEATPNYGIYFQPYTDLGCLGAGVYGAFHALNPVANPYVDDCRTGLGPREQKAQYTADRDNRTNSLALTTTWQLADALTLTAVSSWDKGGLTIPEDSDGSDLGVMDITYIDRVHQVAQELRLTSNLSGPFNFIAGAYVNHEDVFNSTIFAQFTNLDIPDANGTYYGATSPQSCENGIALGLLDCHIVNTFDQWKTAEAVYTDMKLATSKHVTLRLGLRYNYDKGEQSNFTSNVTSADGPTNGVFIANLIPGPAPFSGFAPGCSGNASNDTAQCGFSKSEPTGKIGLDYTTDAGNLLYLTVSRGYRASAFNAQAFFQPGELTVAKPEIINAYEVGTKSRFLDNRLQFNSAIFYYQYRDQQVLSVDPITAQQRLINLDRSRIAGAEFELDARPIPRLLLSTGLGLLDTRVQAGVISGVSVVGNQLTSAPRVSASAAAEWTFFSNDRWNGSVRLDGTYSTRQYFDPNNQLPQTSYGLLNARLSVRSASDRYGIAVWGNNLLDKFYFTNRIAVPGFGFIYNHEGDPLMFGITLDYRM
jgi:iron complex outermembrane receptor protein